MDSFTTLVNIVFTQSVTPSVILLMFRPAELKPQIYFFLLAFEPATAAIEGPKPCALHRMTTGTDLLKNAQDHA
jgi:hypothetical protein